jgi:hypothetical protein
MKKIFSKEPTIMITPDEIRNELQERMRRVNVTAGSLATLAQMSLPQLSGFMSGKRQLEINHVQRINTVMTYLEAIAAKSPLPVAFNDVTKVRGLVERIEKHGPFEVYLSPIFTTGISALAGI